jgi:hypothetical protein
MRFHFVKSGLNRAVGLTIVLLLGASLGHAQQQVNLAAGPFTLIMPDGASVPMWGYSCGATATGSLATCSKLNPAATGWSPVVITVPTGQSLTINLTNSLQFGTAPNVNNIPTSIVIVGQVGGGLGDLTQRTTTPSPTHSSLGVSWPIAGPPDTSTQPGGNPATAGNATFNPPLQGPRVQSFSTEVGAGATTSLTWSTPRPGTYLLESGTHPSIQAPMGLIGMLVVTTAPASNAQTETAAGTAYPATASSTAVTYDAGVPAFFSEIDPVQNAAVNAAVNTAGFSETMIWSGQPNGCGNPASTTYHQCYPPAVNYTPLYYLINGVAFNKTNASASLFPSSPGNTDSTATGYAGTVLVRLVNAGLNMHVPSIVGSLTGTTGASGFSLVAEDGNVLPGLPRVQSEVFMAAGKTYDVMINVPTSGLTALPIFDRQLSLSGNAVWLDTGMLAYIGVNGAQIPSAGVLAPAVANGDKYGVSCQTNGSCNMLTVADVSRGVIANDVNVFGVQVSTAPTNGTLVLNVNGTFTYTPTGTSWSGDSFVYQANGSGPTATVTLSSVAAEAAGGITCAPPTYTASTASYFKVNTPGVLAGCRDAAGYALTVDTTTVVATGMTVTPDVNGGFTASAPTGSSGSFTFRPKNSQGTLGPSTLVKVNFPAASGLKVTVLDGTDKKTPITDYRWIIEEDRTFYVDPTKTTNTGSNIVPTFGTNFHTSYMPVTATGCTGPLSCESGQTVLGQKAVCDVGNGACRTTDTQETAVDPSQVGMCSSTAVPPVTTNCLDPKKRYYISVLPGDAANPFIGANGSAPANCSMGSYNSDGTLNTSCGHGMGGAPIMFPTSATAVTVYTQPSPFPPAKLSVFVFEDDFPLNGEQDAGGGIDVLATNEPGLGGFQITLFDDAGGTGDATGQPTYDMFNMPLSNSLAGTIDPATGNDACPISKNAKTGSDGTAGTLGITGMIVTCPMLESDGKTLSPLAGQAVIANLYPGRYGVVATPSADRIARGEEWLQTNTLDGQKAHDSFLRIGEPSYFQEFGPAGYHVSIGFANPKIIQSRLAGVCAGTDPILTGATNCTNTLKGLVTTNRMSRAPDERLYSSGDNSSFAFTQCYVSFGDPDGEDFAFTKCNGDGTFTLTGLPDGDWRVTVFDQWNDMLVDGLSTPVRLGGGKPVSMEIPMNQWQANIYTRSFLDTNGDGVSSKNTTGVPCTGPNTPAGCNANYGNDTEPGLTLVATNIRFRDGSFSNFNNTDLNGYAGFNEVFPLFSWYVIETDQTRYKNTGTHVVYDSGGPADGSNSCGQNGVAACGSSTIGNMMARTYEDLPLPGSLHVPGAVYCNNADCTGQSIKDGPKPSAPNSTGRIDPPWVLSEGWQGFSGQNSFVEFGKSPYVPGENGGIRGHVIYASTRPFDDPQLLLQTSWEPLVPGVTINLYAEGTAADGSQTLSLVDTTKTSSFDDWAQGFRSDGVPNMNCPGQGTATGIDADIFFFTLFNQPMWLDVYNNGGTPAHTIPNNSQFKCYDGMHNWNQVEPAPYDGAYSFPSVVGRNPSTGNTTGTNCTICVKNNDPADSFRFGKEDMLPSGKYVVEVVVPPGYELVKEEDKNILIGDNYIAPVTQEFGGVGNIFILPDQAAVGATYNSNSSQNATQDLGRTLFPSSEGDTGSVEVFWPCVGELRTVPDYISLFPQSGEVSPFAGASRHLCDRKEVTLTDQTSSLAKFYIFTSTHVAAHFTGVITDDFTSEFDPFSPQFGEKFSPPNLPISIKDWTGSEISRVYSDAWGTYNGLTYSTWEVNPPNPTGYAPTMMVTCMNDPGTGPSPDPLFNPSYSQFCYEIPFMPGQTQYMDTPVVPTSAFAGAGYNNPDCNYPDATPAVKEVDGDGIGPWVMAAGNTLTITALGDQLVQNNAYSGPQATTAPFNQKTITRHYGFGSPCTAPTPNSATCNTLSKVTIGGVAATIQTWADNQITVTVPSGVPACGIQQQAQYSNGALATQCGQLLITAGNGKQSIDSVTVTIGGKPPTHVLAGSSIQDAIDAANPGDLIVVNPGTYNELLIMWKPVRLQGVGATTSIINANPHPAGKLDPWRAKVNCLFGLALNGQPYSTKDHLVPNPIPGQPAEPLNLYDPTGAVTCGGWTGFNATPNNPQVDRLPLESLLGWDTTVNGNLAELLQEPSLMGAYEGAGITVLAKGVRYPPGVEVFGGCNCDTATGSFVPHEGQMPVPTVELTANDCSTSTTDLTNPFPSNFQCNPSRIDGIAITSSSQGGGGIFIHAWAHNLEIANNRIYNNAGTMSGGITVGQAESPDALLAGNGGDPVGYNGGVLAGFDQQPWTCVPGAVVQSAISPSGFDQVVMPPGFVANQQLPYCYNLNVNVHNNAVTSNSSIGDEAFSSTPAGGGGVTFCTGADYYKFNYNWVCGNLSTGDGGGLAHLGFSYSGDIEHNTIVFNQSTNPTIPTNGGGLIVMSTAPDGSSTTQPECGSVTDVDCAPGLGDGTGPGLVINANFIVGNQAESGSGGGLALQHTNGTDVVALPTTPSLWNSVSVTNNIIANNVSGWDGAGVSLLDSLSVNFVNNTVISNDSTASAGVLFTTLGAPLASTTGTNCMTSSTSSCPQPAGMVSIPNSAVLLTSLPATITCPTGHYSGASATNGTCRSVSYPLLANDVFWQNRSFQIGVGSLGSGTQNQQNVVALFNSFTNSRVTSEPSTPATTANGSGSIITGGTGACVSGTSYWDVGVRGDTGPNNHNSGFTLAPTYSVLTDAADYPGANNIAFNPTVVRQYCNGSRTPPEYMSMGYQVPPGISDATVPNPIFSLTPAATVDEGNNWVNISWGPLALSGPAGTTLGNYALAAGSPAIDYVPTASAAGLVAPGTDFFGNNRPDPGNPAAFDVGAIEFQANGFAVPTLTSISPATVVRGTTAVVTLTGTNLTSTKGVNISTPNIAVTRFTVTSPTTVSVTLNVQAAATTGPKTISVTTLGGTSNTVGFTVVSPTLTSIAPNSATANSAVNVTLTGSNLTGVVAVGIVAPNITVSNVKVVNDTTVTATFTLNSATLAGSKVVTVTNSGGATSNGVLFTVVTTTGPVLTGISPASGLAGTAVNVTLNGTNLTGVTAVNIANAPNISVSNVSVVNDSMVTATITMNASVVAGAKNVTVTRSGVISNSVQFTALRPTLTGISPAVGLRGTSVAVTLTGTNLGTATGVTVSGSGVSVSGMSANAAGTQLTAMLTIAITAGLGNRNVTVTIAGGAVSNSVTLTVQGPTLSSISPNAHTRGGTGFTVTLTGTNLSGATGVTVSGSGVAVSNVVVVNSTTVTATFTISSSASQSRRGVAVVTNNIGTTNNVSFTVQ